MKFTQLILESNSPILYHRSFHKFKDGEILEAKLSSKYNSDYENILEEYRLLNKPNLPSRKKCFYLSPDLRSRFHYRGFLYQVKPLSQIHITNSNIIDNLGSSSMDGKKQIEEKLTKEYWNPGTKWVNKNQIRNIEVLCEKIQIIKKIENNELFEGNKLKCVRSFKYKIEESNEFLVDKFLKYLIDKNIIGRKSKKDTLYIEENSKWTINHISKSNELVPQKNDGNIWGIDLISTIDNVFKLEFTYGFNGIPNLNRFLKEHFIKL